MVAKKTAVEHPATGRARGAAAKKTTAKKTATEKTATEKTATKKAATKKAAAKETAAKKTAVRKVDAKTATKAADARKPAEKAAKKPAEKPAGKKTVARKPAAGKKAAVKGVAVDKAAVKAAAAGVSSETAGKSTAKKAGAARAAKQTGATTVVAKKTPGTATAAQTAVPKARIAAAEPGELAVRPGEEPWTPEEVADARAELLSEVERLRTEISSAEASLVGLMRDSGDGAGDDQADTGTKNITREHELALAANAREMLIQNEHALERLDAGTYGLCENCGNPIGKARMQAFPRATLCVECKQKQERRS
ncbi:TraR/DksA family transcriptional regulator [Streptomyces sp. NPDC046942]|uniref:TraR/DksA family transcriptional regulator n=1 Tax=Streptomyces sp. NPDC046942 TaxID=3155137 RepID=UPI0033F1F19C